MATAKQFKFKCRACGAKLKMVIRERTKITVVGTPKKRRVYGDEDRSKK